MSKPRYTNECFGHSPLIVFYETTRACNLMCVHCRASAQRTRHPEELSPTQALQLVDELTKFPRPPLLVLTGGDPIKRPDAFDIIAHCKEVGIESAMTPSATPLVTADVVRRLKDSGLHRLAVSLDGADAATHDGFRRVPGSFDRTLRIMDYARDCGLSVQINTTISKINVAQVDAMANLLAGMGIAMWSVFFLVPTGRALAEQRITAPQYEEVFEKLRLHSLKQPYAIKTTEAPHYRRFLLEKAAVGLPAPMGPMVGTNDGRGVMFVSHIGEIFPSGFLPIECGRFPADSIVDVYQNSPTFVALRDPDQLKGKCSRCDYRRICGGSRARAYGLTGDMLAAEPDCVYQPSTSNKDLSHAQRN